MIGIKPQFGEDEVEEGATANFDVIVVDPAGERIAAPGLTWRLDRIVSDYQWYSSDGNWSYEVVTSAERVATGTVDAGAAGPVTSPPTSTGAATGSPSSGSATRPRRPATSSMPAGTFPRPPPRRPTSSTSRSTSPPTASARRRSFASIRASPASPWSQSSTTG
jgi:hypothetical protein